MKDFRFTENRTVQFHAEFFNLFNHANFGILVNDLNVPDSVKDSFQTSQPGRLVQPSNSSSDLADWSSTGGFLILVAGSRRGHSAAA